MVRDASSFTEGNPPPGSEAAERAAGRGAERAAERAAERGAERGARRGVETGTGDTGRPPPRRKRRWLRILVTVAILLLVLGVAIQLVLWSNLPKRLVLAQLQSQLGLRVEANSLTTGWLGNTSLRDVTLALPTAEEAFLDMPGMKVKHTSLFGLLLRRPVSVDLIELHNPTLYVRRDDAGRWNLQEVAELVARAGGSKPAEESAQANRPKLPEVRLFEGTVVVQDWNKPEVKVRPLGVHGRPDPRTPGLVYRYDVEVPDHLKLVGYVTPGGTWEHDVKITVANLHDYAKPWAPDFPQDARVAVDWRGEMLDGKVSGRLTLDEVKAAGVGAKGVVMVSSAAGTVTLNPDGLTVTTANQMLAELKVASGAIIYDGRSVRSDRLYVAALGGQVRVDGDYTLASRSGQLKADWLEVTTGAVKHGGSLDARVSAPFQNRPQVEATLVSHGLSPDGPWDAKFQLNGTSQGGWGDMDYVLTAPQLDWHGNYPLDLDGLSAKLETRVDEQSKQRVIRLAQLTSPGNHVESVGEFNLATQNWKFWISLNALPIPGESGGTSVGVAVRKENAAAASTQPGDNAQAKQNAASMAVLLNAWGDPQKLEVGEFLVRGAELELRANGQYFYDRPSPLDLKLKVKHIPPRIAERDRPPVYGYISGEGSVRGTVLSPRNLNLEGKLIGEGVTVYKRSLGDVNVKITGHADNNHAVVKSEQLELLKGHWSFDALYTRQSKAVAANLRVADLDLKEVGDLLQPFDPNDTRPVRRTEQETNLLGGVMSGNWNFSLAGADKDRVRVEGNVKVRDVRAPGFAADALEAKTVLDDGNLALGPVNLRRAITRTADGKETRLDGKAVASMSADLDDLTQVTATLALENWPLEAGAGGWVDISGGTDKLVIDLASDPDAKQRILPGKSAAGSLQFTSNLTYNGSTLGKAEMRADVMGRMIDLRTVKIQTLDGSVDGQGVIELEKPLEARAFFGWEKVNSQRLVEMFPALKGLEGIFTGRLRVQPARDPRALGPLAVSFELVPEGGHYKAVQIGKTTILAYADLNRIVLNDPADIASTVEIAGGLMTLWGRVSYHNLETTKDAVSSQMLINFRDLDLNQIIKAANPEATDTPGRLDGNLTIIGATRGPRVHPRPPGVPPVPFAQKLVTAIRASGPVRLRDAKLGRLPAISFLYDVMSLGQNVKDNNGVGDVQVQLENGVLRLTNLEYFNRGTEVRSPELEIQEVWKLPDSPMRGTLFGSLRPLASLNLPFIAEADRLIALVSADLVAITIEGTVKNGRYQQLGLKELGQDLKAALFGGSAEPAKTTRSP